ncbi:unnamed protein product [Rotaria sordida]|uniref:Uncharacterized protein n=1 Tax=Rotaria sordida TaxID=392033 RepID=A0A814C2N3_9BILA|nr:unnamed protein product [Rotaria sordida]CAF3626809.1 unnamed protein product [Rotaria sordida]
MKIIIIFSILSTVQGLNIDNGLISNENSSITNDLNLVTQSINESDRTIFLQTSNDLLTSRFDIDEINYPTIIPENISSDITFESQTWPSLFVHDNSSLSTFLPTTDFDYTTSLEQIKITIEQQWFNINQSHLRDPYRSVLYWKYASDSAWHDATYILTSKPQCIRQMCSVILKYNGTSSNLTNGCLSFTLRTRGHPVGQLWIIEDHQKENASQKIQLTNKTLHVEHTLKSKIKNLSIETRILFHNPKLDTLILSNLNINWKGPCPKQPSIPTLSPDIIGRRSTLEDDFMTLTSQDSNYSSTLITSEEFTNSQQSLIYESTTITFDQEIITKSSFSLFNQKNIGWFLSLIALFCFFIVLCTIGHSLWLIRRQRYFTWHVTFDSQIRLLARRSIRSSTRSETKIATVSQIAYDILNDDAQKEHTTETPTTNSNRSTPISYYTYL